MGFHGCAVALRAIVVPLAFWFFVGGTVTPDPAAVVFLTAVFVAGLCAVGPVRRAWVGWIRTGRLPRAGVDSR